MGEFDVSDEPVITDAEVEAAVLAIQCAYNTAQPSSVRAALAAFFKARVPSVPNPDSDPWDDGFNACREAVLRGKG